MSSETTATKIRVSPEVARIVAKEAPRELKLAVARGAHPLPPRDLITALYFVCHGSDVELRTSAIQTLRNQPAETPAAVAGDTTTPGQILHFLAQVRLHDPLTIAALLDNPATPQGSLTLICGKCGREILPLLLGREDLWRRDEATVTALRANPHLTPAEQQQITGGPAAAEQELEAATEPPPVEQETAAEGDEKGEDEEEAKEEEEEENASKYQQALEMGVGEKIKMALTGDKEWRTIFLKDPNKLVHGAVLKNPRITDGEVLAVSKNKASSEELIRIILLNNDWIKIPSIRAALVTHPKTPIPQALRFMNILTPKDLKVLCKSKGVSQIIVNAARRMVSEKDKKK